MMMGMTLQRICEDAAAAGRDIDLTGCDYGPHTSSGLHLGVQPYYHFLAGFVRALGLGKVLEIGTSYGGSMMAMDRGAPGAERVTVDKTDMAGDGLKALGHIKRVIGDSLAAETLRKVKVHMSAPIDLLYIDSKHSYDHTKGNIARYGGEFRPRYVILDDIHLNAEMDRFWNHTRETFGDCAFDASELAGRPCGFGVLDFARANPRGL
jgi:hypothetical protein